MVQPRQNCGSSRPPHRPHAEAQREQSNSSVVCADRSLNLQAEEAWLLPLKTLVGRILHALVSSERG